MIEISHLWESFPFVITNFVSKWFSFVAFLQMINSKTRQSLASILAVESGSSVSMLLNQILPSDLIIAGTFVLVSIESVISAFAFGYLPNQVLLCAGFAWA
jgi:hypothetical protein